MNLLRSKGVLLLVVMGICSFSVLNVRQAMAYNNPFKISFFSTDESGEGESGEGSDENGEGENGESGEGSFEDRCKNAGYLYNYALLCEESKLVTQKCSIDGELTVWGKTIFSFSYKKGKEYSVFVDIFKCFDDNKGNCCNSSNQGAWIGEKPPVSPI